MSVFRVVVASVAASLTALAAPAIGMTAVSAAGAATLDPVTSITITAPDASNPSAPLTAGQQFSVSVAWALPSTTRPGDTFSVSFPSPVKAFAATFDLIDAGGAKAGSCSVTANAFNCTIGAYAADHANITGTLHFLAYATQSVDQSSLPFTSSAGAVYQAPLPGGKVLPGPYPALPTTLVKGGWQNPDGTLGWRVMAPGDLVAAGSELAFTDTLQSGLQLDPGSVRVLSMPAANWNGDWAANSTTLAQGATPGTYSWGTTANTFALTIHGPDPALIYAVYYTTRVPNGTAIGTRFTNTVHAVGAGSADAVAVYAAAGGTISGTPVVQPTPGVPSSPKPSAPASPATVAPRPSTVASPAAHPAELAETGVDEGALLAASTIGILLLLSGIVMGRVSARRRRENAGAAGAERAR